MKLSNLRTGDILKVSCKYDDFYIVLSDMITYETNTETNKIVYMTIVCHKLFKGGQDGSLIKYNLKYNLNKITPQEILNDEYPPLASSIGEKMEKVDRKELPLLIGLPNKTIWFRRTINNEIRGTGSELHKRMLDILYNEKINEEAEVDEVITMYENGQDRSLDDTNRRSTRLC